MILSVDIRLCYAGGRARMIGRGAPAIFEQLTLPSFSSAMQRQFSAEPGRLESALAISAVLVAEHPKPPFLIAAQSVRA